MAKFTGKIITCLECKKEFKIPSCRENTAKYCSKECADIHRHDKSRKNKIVVKCLHCGKVFLEHVSHASRRKYCSYSCANKEFALRCNGRGDKHFYNRSFWRKLRKLVIERDGYCCSECKSTKRRISIHHLTPRILGGKDEVSNLIPLCNPCHMNLHKQKTIVIGGNHG